MKVILLSTIITISVVINAQPKNEYFTFLDAEGKEVKSSDFKGKLVVVDFWYTGCTGCVHFYKDVISKLKEQLRADTNIVFLSISADRDKEVWLKSVQSGVYTNNEAINLYTGESSFQHNMLTRFNVRIFPHLQIIDSYGLHVAIIHKPYKMDKSAVYKLISSFR